jgi:hypothetical protein
MTFSPTEEMRGYGGHGAGALRMNAKKGERRTSWLNGSRQIGGAKPILEKVSGLRPEQPRRVPPPGTVQWKQRGEVRFRE